MKLTITTLTKVWADIEAARKWFDKVYKGENIFDTKPAEYSAEWVREEHSRMIRKATKAFHHLPNCLTWGFTWNGESPKDKSYGGVAFECLDGVKDLRKYLYMGLLRRSTSSDAKVAFEPTKKGILAGIKGVKI